MTQETIDTIVAVHTAELTQQAKLFASHCEKQNRNLERIWEALESIKVQAAAQAVGRISKLEAAAGAALFSALIGLMVYVVTGR